MKFITFLLLLYQISFLICANSSLKSQTVTATATNTEIKAKTIMTTKTNTKTSYNNKNEFSSGISLENKYKTESSLENLSEEKSSSEALYKVKSKTSTDSQVNSQSSVEAATNSESKTKLKSLFSVYDKNVNPGETNLLADDLFNAYAANKVEGAPPIQFPNGPVYWQGWVKYFHFISSRKWKRPQSFFENSKYYTQRVLEEDFGKKDKNGFLFIPTRDHFYASLEKNHLVFMSDRSPETKNVIDTLNTDLIKPISSDFKFHGGITNLGEFKEGFCIQIETVTPIGADPSFEVDAWTQGEQEKWIICTQDNKSRNTLLNVMVNLKLLKQKVAGKDFTGTPKPPTKPNINSFLYPDPTPKIEKYTGNDAKPFLDGYWILLWDWSQCTLKCGGGFQYQQWMCVPPKAGGKPCQGKAIRRRPCNTHPCPGITTVNGKKKSEEVTLKPIIKSMPFSNRPQRYIKCEVKESDVFYMRYDTAKNIGIPMKYPARLIMNRRTIALYTDDSLENSVFTYNLMDTIVKVSKIDPCCLDILSMNKQQTICGFDQGCGTKDNPIFVKQWSNDINEFTRLCFHNLKKNDINNNNNDDNDKKKGPGFATLEDRRKIIQKNLKKMEKNVITKKISKAQDTTLQAIKKELKMEDLIKKEMQLKAKEELKELLNLKRKEEFKKDCLLKALKARDKKAEDLHKETQGNLEVEKTYLEAKRDIKGNREELKKKLMEIKKKALRRKRMIEQQIQLIRGEMTKNLLDANKFGSMEICRKSNSDIVKIKEYCNANFVDNYMKNVNCKEVDNFCYICCENEFGNMYIKYRDKCYTMCDEMLKKDLEGGDWIWTREGFNNSQALALKALDSKK